MDEIIKRPESAEDAALSKIIARHEWATSRGVPLRYQRRDIDDLLGMLRTERAKSEGLRAAAEQVVSDWHDGKDTFDSTHKLSRVLSASPSPPHSEMMAVSRTVFTEGQDPQGLGERDTATRALGEMRKALEQQLAWLMNQPFEWLHPVQIALVQAALSKTEGKG